MKIEFLYTKIFTVLLAIFYVLGLAGVFLKSEILFAFLCLVVVIALIFFSNLGLKKSFILYLIFFIGLLRAHQAQHFSSFIDEINSNSASSKGIIVSSKNISTKNNKLKFYLKASEINVYNKDFKNLNERILVSYEIKNGDDINFITIADGVKVKGKIRTPMEATNPHQFDYKGYLLNNNCRYIFYADEIEKISEPVLSKDIEQDWYYILKKFEITRNKILSSHAKNIKSPNLEILGGIVFGNETINPDEEVKESFRNSGLLHLLAASGLNVALIFGIWWWISNLIKFPYNLSIFIGALFVVFYTFMTGFPPSILRASLMLLFVLFGKLIDRQADSIALIFFIGFLILLFNPKMLFDIGFQLSFAVTFGLIYCCPVFISKFDNLEKRFVEKHKKLSYFKKYIFFIFSPKSLGSIVIVPLVAQIWVIPLQMHYFNNLAPLSLLANIAVVPFIGVLSFIGFVSSIVALVPVLDSPIVYLFDLIANPLLGLLIKISSFFSSFKYSLVTTTGLNPFQIFTFWGLVLIFTFNLKNNFKNKKLFSLFLGIVLIFSLSFIKPSLMFKELELAMFDVGNADSFLIKTPKNKYFLIDTGKKTFKSFSSGESVINPYFKNERITHLHSMIITHFDTDHSGGAAAILKETKTDNVYIQKESYSTAAAAQIMDYLKENNVNYKIAQNREEIYLEKDLKMTIFKPKFNNSFKDLDNEESIITLLTYKNKNILFMADCARSAFLQIEKYLPNKIDILKVGHHGAKDVVDKTMLERIKPDYALISTGINRFNHPHYSTITLLNEQGVKIILSKDYGFSKVKIKNDKISFYHFDTKTKKLKPLLFDKEIPLSFEHSEYVQKLIKENL